MSGKWLGFQDFPQLESEHLILRQILEGDFKYFYELFCDEKVNAHIQLDWANPKKAREIFNSMMQRFENNAGIRWSIILKDSQEWIGNFGFHNPRLNELCVERGLQIATKYWRKGFGDEASKAGMSWLAAKTPFKNVDAWISSENIAARGLIEKQGFRQCGDNALIGALFCDRFLIKI